MNGVLRRRILATLILLIAVGCEDPTAPVKPDACEPVHACLVAGVDLDVRSVTLATIGTHPVSGLPLVPGDTIRATVVLLNRGSLESEPGLLRLEIEAFGSNHLGSANEEVPSLHPGQEHSITVAVPVFASSLIGLRGERLAMRATVSSLQDSVATNNRRTTDTHILAAPIIQLIAKAGEGRVGGTVPVTLTLINYSTIRDLEPATWRACFPDGFQTCSVNGRSPSGPVSLPALPAGGRTTVEILIPVPPESAFQDEAFDYSGILCPGDAPEEHPELGGCFSLGRVTIRPDYEGICAPPPLSEAAVHLTAWNCGNPHVPRSDLRPPPFHLVALDARAGVTYRIERSTGGSMLRYYDVDGDPVPDLAPAPDELRVDADERIYIVSYSASPEATFRAVPLTGAGS